MALNAKDVTIKAGTEEATSTSSETTRTAGTSYSTNGGASANLSGSNTDADSYSKTHINSSINAGSLTSTSDNLMLSGANIEVASNIDIDTGNLVIESLQDESSSSSKTEGYSASANIGGDKSISPGNFGANENSSKANSQWVNNQTTLIGSISSDKTGSGDVNISADKTTIKGAVVASATRNEDGTLTDNSTAGTGSLNLATDELIIEDIKDKDHSENKGFDVSTSVGYESDNPDTKNTDEGYLTGSTTVGLTSDGHKKEQTTLATLGGGNITKKDGSAHEEGLVESANSDLNNSQEITKDMKTGGLNASVTVDHRLLSENGRNSIKKDVLVSAEHTKEIVQSIEDVVKTDKSILDLASQVHKYAKDREVLMAKAANEEQQNKLKGEEGAEGSESGIQLLTDALSEAQGLAEGADVNLYDGSQTPDGTTVMDETQFNKEIANGGYDESNKDIYINVDQTDMTNSEDVVKIAAHENARHQMNLNGDSQTLSVKDQRTLANNRGERASEVWSTFSGLNGFDTQGSTNRTDWNEANRNQTTIQTGNKNIRAVDSNNIKPALYAFDGTGQDKDESTKDNDTNVAKMHELYDGNKFYVPGVGTNDGALNILGAVGGLGGDARADAMYQSLVNTYNGVDADGNSLAGGADTDIDITGFSRGAALARNFANDINEKGIPDLSSAREVTVGHGNTLRTRTVYDSYLVAPGSGNADIRSLSIYDTVGSFGVAGDSDEGNKNLNIAPNIQNVRHAISRDENRDGFPLTSAVDPTRPSDSRIKEQVFEGYHSDVGGGQDPKGTVEYDALQWQLNEARAAGVPYNNTPETWQPVGESGDRQTFNEFDGELGGVWKTIQRATNAIDYRDAPRTVFYPENPSSEHDQNDNTPRVNINNGVVNLSQPTKEVSVGRNVIVPVTNHIIPPDGNNQTAPNHFEYLDTIQKDSGQPLIYKETQRD